MWPAMADQVRSASVIAQEIQQLNDAKRAGHLSDAAHTAALRALSAELAAATGANRAKASAPRGGVRIACPSCHAPGVYVICLKCRQARSFAMRPDGAVECACGNVIGEAVCTCKARVTSAFFRPVAASELPPLAGEQQGTTAPPQPTTDDALQKAWGGWPGCLAFLAILLCIGVCKGGGSGSSSAAKQAVLSRLKAPSTAQFVETVSYGNGRYFMAVDAQNGFGAMIRGGYCVALKGSDPNAPDQEQVFECSKEEAAILFGK